MGSRQIDYGLNRIFFHTKKANTKSQQSIKFQGLFKVPNQKAEKCRKILENFYKAGQYWINNYLYEPKNPVYEQLNPEI